jgi:hypothetical protein
MKTYCVKDWVPEKLDELNKRYKLNIQRAAEFDSPTLMQLSLCCTHQEIITIIGLHLYQATNFNGLPIEVGTMDMIAEMIFDRYSFLKVTDLYNLVQMAKWGELQTPKIGYPAIVINWVKQYVDLRANVLMGIEKKKEGRFTLEQVHPSIGIRLKEMLAKNKKKNDDL